MLDHLQGLVAILHDDVPAVEVCAELTKTKAHWQNLTLNVGIVSLHISEGFANKGDGPATLE